ncbi:MAG TPA: hypothetical protein VFO16_12915 [Pseudonocardiaceae bacterium]|nr:hypothetical protein [Pseudonocardiaceae bacterium]
MSASTMVTGLAERDPCPYCGGTSGVRQVTMYPTEGAGVVVREMRHGMTTPDLAKLTPRDQL